MTARRAETDVELLARLARDVADLRGTALARMATKRRLEVPVFQGQQLNNQSLASGVETPIVMDKAAHIDTHGGHSETANPARWTCPTGWAGLYVASGHLFIETASANQVIITTIARNGVGLGYPQVNQWGENGFSAATGTVFIVLEEGDYLELRGTQFSGVSRSTVADQCALGIGFVRRG